jgi:two-component system, OmpR family, response regulator
MAEVILTMIARLEKILCVEDEPDVRSVIQLALRRVGKFNVMVCSNGPQALLDGPAFDPDLMMIDVIMPSMSGPAFLEAAREMPELASVPAIFLTGKTNPEDIARYNNAGAVGVIAKPFDVKGLSEEVLRIWNGLDSA